MGRKSIDNERKPQILEHFRQVVNEEGFHKASIAKIAKKMEVSPNLILHYFGSKEAMVVELFDFIMDRYIEYLLEKVKNQPKGTERFKSLIKTMFGLGKNRELLSEKSYYAFYYMSLFDDNLKKLFSKKYNDFSSMITKEIEYLDHFKGKSNDELEKQTQLLLAMFEGFTFKSNFMTNGDYFEKHGNYFFEEVCNLFKI